MWTMFCPMLEILSRADSTDAENHSYRPITDGRHDKILCVQRFGSAETCVSDFLWRMSLSLSGGGMLLISSSCRHWVSGSGPAARAPARRGVRRTTARALGVAFRTRLLGQDASLRGFEDLFVAGDALPRLLQTAEEQRGHALTAGLGVDLVGVPSRYRQFPDAV